MSEYLQPYSAFRPTGFDRAGLALDDQQDWYVAPVGRNRDNEDDPCTASNWDCTIAELEDLDPDGETWEVHSFGHWACGWFEIIIVKPDTPAMEAMEATACALENYPVLDDSDFYEREEAAKQEAWADLSDEDKVRLLREHGLLHSFKAALVDLWESAPWWPDNFYKFVRVPDCYWAAGLRADLHGDGSVSWYAEHW